jgi:hypothetical protein
LENDIKTYKKEQMKTKTTALLISLLALASLPAFAQTTYSGSDFSTMASYNGNYVAGPPGYEALSYNSSPNGDVDAVVGVRGSLGTLNSLSMSFTYDNLISSGSDVPFAAFGISAGTWGTGAQEYDVISEDGNQLYGYSTVHVWDLTTGADVTGFGQSDNKTLNDVLATFGTLDVMRAYAYVGDEGASSGSVDITSITVGSYVASAPDGGSTVGLLGVGFFTLLVFSFRQNRLAMAK